MSDLSEVASIAVSSTVKENPTPSAKTCTECTNYSFFLQMKQTEKLKMALTALVDLELNPIQAARIDVDHLFFEITVRRAPTCTICFLSLKASGLVRFECRKPMDGKMFYLRGLLEMLINIVKEGDIVTVYHVDGSNTLSIKATPTTECADAPAYNVMLHEAFTSYQRCPDVIFNWEAVMLTEHLREMITKRIEGNSPRKVSVKITSRSARITIGKEKWSYDYIEKKNEPRGFEQGQKTKITFKFRHTESLKNASYLDVGFLFCKVEAPRNCIMLRFNLRELGDLAYIM